MPPRPARLLAVALGLTLGCLATAPASASPTPDTAVVTLAGGSAVGTMDTSTGATTTWTGPGHSSLFGTAFGNGGDLFGLEGGQLVRLDQTTGAATPIGPRQGLQYGLDQAPDGTMYAVSYNGPNGSGLYEVDTSTGALTFVGADSGAMDVTFDCAGTLWGVDSNRLMSFDLRTGQVTSTVTMTGDPGASNIMGLITDARGDLLGSTYSNPAKLFRIDSTTGALTLLSSSAGNVPHGGDDARACADVVRPSALDGVSGNSTFGGPAVLRATLSQGGTGVAGKDVTFSLGGTPVGTATTGSDGVATLAGVDTGSRGAGAYTGLIGADFAGDGGLQSSSATGDLVVHQATQTVRFTSVDPGPVVGSTDYTPTAEGGASGNPTVISLDPSTTGSACDLVGGKVTFRHAGTCVLAADQLGTTNYSAAPTARQSITVGVAPQALHLTSTPPAAVVGGSWTATAAGGDSGEPVVFGLDPATTGGACSVTPTGLVSFAHRGSCVVTVDQAGNSDFAAAPTLQQSVPVSPAATTISLVVGARSLTAHVPTPAGAGAPTGTVRFSVDGIEVGSAPIDATGTATLAYVVPQGAARRVAAAYDGSSDLTGSVTSTSPADPSITARVSSARPRTSSGWYSTGVVVRFTCTAGSAPLTSPCPSPVTLNASGAGQSVTRSVGASDGGAASVSVVGLNIDRTAPAVRVVGVRDGGLYRGAAPRPSCAGQDRLSGVVACTVRTQPRADGSTSYTATATNGAGLRSVAVGTFRSLDMWLQGVPWRHGRFEVQAGRTVTLLVASRARPTYEWAAPVTAGSSGTPRGGHDAFYADQAGVWRLRVSLTQAMTRRFPEWKLGARVDGRLRVVRIAFTR